MERLLDDEIVKQLSEMFANLKHPVALLYFGNQTDCEYCPQTLQLLEEIAVLSDRLQLYKFDEDENPEELKKFNVDKVPGIVIASLRDGEIVDHGIRYAGIPAGHEFTSLIRDILMVSSGDSGLKQETRDYLASLEKPIFLQVFVTPTCPYCPQAVVLAHQMAFESPNGGSRNGGGDGISHAGKRIRRQRGTAHHHQFWCRGINWSRSGVRSG